MHEIQHIIILSYLAFCFERLKHEQSFNLKYSRTQVLCYMINDGVSVEVKRLSI